MSFFFVSVVLFGYVAGVCFFLAVESFCTTESTFILFYFLFLHPLVCLGMSLFPSIFCTISAFSLYEEYVERSFLPNNGVFLPCDHGLGCRGACISKDDWTKGRRFNESIKTKNEANQSKMKQS